jgi:hypothetical protein
MTNNKAIAKAKRMLNEDFTKKQMYSFIFQLKRWNLIESEKTQNMELLIRHSEKLIPTVLYSILAILHFNEYNHEQIPS